MLLRGMLAPLLGERPVARLAFLVSLVSKQDIRFLGVQAELPAQTCC